MNVITDILDTLLNLLRSEGMQEWGAWSYPLLVVLVIIEGPIVTLLASVAASVGYMRLPLVMVSALVGSAIADTLWYYLGYTHSEERILRYGRWLGLRRHHVEQLQKETPARSQTPVRRQVRFRVSHAYADRRRSGAGAFPPLVSHRLPG